MNSARHGTEQVGMGGFQTHAYLLHAMPCRVHNKSISKKTRQTTWGLPSSFIFPVFFSQSYILMERIFRSLGRQATV